MTKKNPFESVGHKPIKPIVSRETDEALQSVKALLRKARKDAFVAGYNQGLGSYDNVSEELIEEYLRKFDAND